MSRTGQSGSFNKQHGSGEKKGGGGSLQGKGGLGGTRHREEEGAYRVKGAGVYPAQGGGHPAHGGGGSLQGKGGLGGTHPAFGLAPWGQINRKQEDILNYLVTLRSLCYF